MMGVDPFVKVEREGAGGREIHLIHKRSPKFSLQLTPLYRSDGRLCGGTIKRIQFPNSWARDYHHYSRWIRKAEQYFRDSLENEDAAALPLPR